MNPARISSLLLIPAGLVFLSCAFKGETLQVIHNGEERIEIVTRPTAIMGSAQVFLIHYKGNTALRTIGLHGFDTEAHHEFVSASFDQQKQTAKVKITNGSYWLVNLVTGKADLMPDKAPNEYHRPNP